MVLFVFLAALFVVVGVLSLMPGFTRPIRDQHGHSLAGSIASLEKVVLGGSEQWILLRGADATRPVILFLHGGPGTAQMAFIRKYTTELEKHFVVVDWDQRGAGKSFPAKKPPSAMNIDQFVADASELTKLLRDRFHQKKIYLAGHSWGSVIGVLTVQKNPNLFYAYIGIGQAATIIEGENASYEWVVEQAEEVKDARSLKTLRKLGMPPHSGDWHKYIMTQRRIVGKYGGEVHRSSKGALPLVLGGLMRSSEYTLSDKVNFFRGILSSGRILWPQLIKIDLIARAPSLKVPVYFFLGKHDHEVPFTVAEQYFKMLDAPAKELIWFENSAHMLICEENEKFSDLLVNKVVSETYR